MSTKCRDALRASRTRSSPATLSPVAIAAGSPVWPASSSAAELNAARVSLLNLKRALHRGADGDFLRLRQRRRWGRSFRARIISSGTDFFFFSSRKLHTRYSDDLLYVEIGKAQRAN